MQDMTREDLQGLIDPGIVTLEDAEGHELTPDQAVDKVGQGTAVFMKAMSGNVYRLVAYDGDYFSMVEETIMYKIAEVEVTE